MGKGREEVCEGRDVVRGGRRWWGKGGGGGGREEVEGREEVGDGEK